MPLPDFKVHFLNNKFIYEPPLHLPVYGTLPRSREKGIAEMIKSVVERHKITEEFSIHVRIADGPWEAAQGYHKDPPEKAVSESLPETYYSLCVYNERYHKVFPDFVYVGFPETGLINYTETINSFIDTIPRTNKIGWCGCQSCGEKNARPKFLQMSREMPHILDGRDVCLPLLTEDGWKDCNARMSYQDQIDEWKYLIDIEGCGYSGRFKILMNTPRIVFFVDRPYQEWFFGNMIPWTHYVPVKRDLSDLLDNYQKIELDLDLQEHIKKNQKIFAKKYLTREAAENRVYEIVKDMILFNKIKSIKV